MEFADTQIPLESYNSKKNNLNCNYTNFDTHICESPAFRMKLM
jgi:hypothetical protein